MFKFLKKTTAGFTLIEAIVCLSIITVLITVVFRNQNSYVEYSSLADAAETIASDIILIQNFALAAREIGVGTANFSTAYGISMTTNTTSDMNKFYITFIDVDNDSTYDGTWDCSPYPLSECIGKGVIPRGNYIGSLCMIPFGLPFCIGSTLQRVDIVFKRPNTLPTFAYGFSSAVAPDTNPSIIQAVQARILSPSGKPYFVQVFKSGLVAVATSTSYGY